MENYIDSVVGMDYMSAFDRIVLLGISSKQIKSDICINPFLDSRTDLYIRYEMGSEEGIGALFLHDFCSSPSDYIESLDYGYLLSETNISEEEMHKIRVLLGSTSSLLIVGSSFYLHDRHDNILRMFSHIANNINVAFLSTDVSSLYLIKKSYPELDSIHDIPDGSGCIIYVDFNISLESTLRFSSEFARAWNISSGDLLEIILPNMSIRAKSILDYSLDGVIALLSLDNNIDCGYRYKRVLINKISSLG